MSGLIESLASAARAMQAHSLGIETAGHNMANLNTPGYARRIVHLAEVPPSAGGGVRTAGAAAVRDALLDARLRRELPAAGREAAVADGLSVVETSLGRPGESLDRDLTAFFDAWSALAQEPASTTARDNVIQQAKGLAQSFGELSVRLDRSQQEADLQVRGTLERINVLTRDVASLNAAIARANGSDTSALQDRLSGALDELSGLANIRVLRQGDGTSNISLPSGQALVVGEHAYPLEAGSDPSGLTTLHLGAQDVTDAMTGGRMAGLLHLRDSLVPGYRAQLDQLAFDVATEVNALHQTGFDAHGAAGGAFFVAPTGVAGAADALAVDPDVAADGALIAASGSGAIGDNEVAQALAALRDLPVASGGRSTLTEAWGQIVYRVGTDSAGAQSLQRSRQGIADAVARLKDSISGVSLDEEAASLIKYQRAYEANARFFAAVGETIDVLLQIV